MKCKPFQYISRGLNCEGRGGLISGFLYLFPHLLLPRFPSLSLMVHSFCKRLCYTMLQNNSNFFQLLRPWKSHFLSFHLPWSSYPVYSQVTTPPPPPCPSNVSTCMYSILISTLCRRCLRFSNIGYMKLSITEIQVVHANYY